MEPLPSMFQSFKLSAQEESLGQQLTSLNVAVIHNLRSTIAIEKIHLDFDPAKMQEFIQQDAYKRGQIEMLTYLLDCNESATQSHHITGE